MTLCHRARSTSRNGTGDASPAMLASAPTGGRPASAISDTECWMLSGSVTSTASPTLGTSNSSRSRWAAVLTPFWSMSRRATAHPSWAYRLAVA